MREILFRAKRSDTGEWVEGDLVRLKDGKKSAPYIYGFGEVIPETVGQYTGLKDKNGKRIFEGDIVRINERGYVAEGGKIVFRNGYPGGWIITNKTEEANCSLAWRSCVEVTGNAHDNPELLEVEE